MGTGAPKIYHDLGGIDAPKLKFIFTVEFGFRGINPHKGTKDLQTIEYDLKSATRPNISVNQEDVNYYNYRTKVATRVSFGTVRLSMYEDSLNVANGLIWDYIKAISPITRQPQLSISTEGESVSPDTASTIGPLTDTDGPIAWMKVHHHYTQNGQNKVTTYTYGNPKIENVDIDELDMSSNEASTVNITFTVDSVNVEHT